MLTGGGGGGGGSPRFRDVDLDPCRQMTSLGHNELTTFEAILHKTGQICPKSCHLLRKKWLN